MPEPCRSCDRRSVDFGGCRCQAFALAGDAAATDPACALSPRHDLVTARAHARGAPAAPPTPSACADFIRGHERPAIEVEELAKRYGDVEAVRGIGFSVGAGEIFGFLGPNGAGKTTTIKILCTLLQPTSGRARLAGWTSVAAPGEVRRRIGVVFQDPALDDRLTAEENLSCTRSLYRVPRAERAARIDEALRFVDLHDRRARPDPHVLGRHEAAAGDRARADPPPDILFLDEPTTGLDPQTRARTWEVLRGLRDKFGTTLFMTTHYMDEAENCDRIAIIDHGKIVALDTPAALKQRVGKDMVTARSADPAALARLLAESTASRACPPRAG